MPNKYQPLFTQAFIQQVKSSEDLKSQIGGSLARRAQELKREHLTDALFKSYLVEIPIPTGEIERELRDVDEFRVYQASEHFFHVLYTSPRNEESAGAFLEILTDRVGVLYTKDKSQLADKRHQELAKCSNRLDDIFITGQSFIGLWSETSSKLPGRRFVEIGCRQNQTVALESSPDSDLLMDLIRDESPATNLVLRNTVDNIKKALFQLQDVYEPFRSIKHLRLPSESGGGHQIYYNGKITNRSPSFQEHHYVVKFIAKFYTNLLKTSESIIGKGILPRSPFESRAYQQPTPLVYKFSTPLDPPFLSRLLPAIFEESGEIKKAFKLRGRVLPMGNTHFQIYGLDRVQNVPIELEITSEHILALVEPGVCANVLQRLIYNLQLYVCPPSEVWLGKMSVFSLALEAAKEANYQYKSSGDIS